MNAVYRRNGLPIAAFIHCMTESALHDRQMDKEDRMEVFAASDSLGRKTRQYGINHLTFNLSEISLTPDATMNVTEPRVRLNLKCDLNSSVTGQQV
jgi:hypothetical protein